MGGKNTWLAPLISSWLGWFVSPWSPAYLKYNILGRSRYFYLRHGGCSKETHRRWDRDWFWGCYFVYFNWTRRSWMIILFIVGMMVISPLYRTKHFLVSISIAFVIALPLISIWPFFLYTTDPILFFEWLNIYNFERMRDIFIISSKDRFFYYIGILPWFSWPAWPFAIWALWISRGQGFQRREIQLPIVTFISILFFLTLSGKGREILALPLLIPLSLLASISFRNIPRGATNAFYWFGLVVSIFTVILCWICYSAIELQHPRWLGDIFLKYQPFYKSNPTPQQIIGGALGTTVWIALIFNLKKFAERSAIVWTTSITIGWFLVVVLLFPLDKQHKDL